MKSKVMYLKVAGLSVKIKCTLVYTSVQVPVPHIDTLTAIKLTLLSFDLAN